MRAMAGFIILPRSKETFHCLTGSGFGATSQVGTAKKDIPRILPVKLLETLERGGEECRPPEQNAEAVMPTVWAMRIVAGRGAIARRCSKELGLYSDRAGFL